MNVISTHRTQVLSHQAPVYARSDVLRVNNLDRVATFYQEIVGLVLHPSMEKQPNTSAQVLLGTVETPLLVLIEDRQAQPRPIGMPGLFHTAFLLPDRRSLGDWLRHVIAQKIWIEGLSDHHVSEAAYLSDPEGNGIEIYADRPLAEWQMANGSIIMGTARMDLESVLAEPGPEMASQSYQIPSAARIGHVHLGVGNITEAGKLISTVFGMKKTNDYPQAAFYASGDYHHHLAANTWQSTAGKLYQPGFCGLAEVRLEASNAEQHAALTARMALADATAIGDYHTMAGPSGIPFTIAML